MNDLREVLVVGACAAGLSTVEALRRRGYDGAVTVLGAEQHLPYDRPPLSKKVLSGEWQPDRTNLRQESALTALKAEFVLADAAVGLDPATRTVRTASGRALTADAVVIATGAKPRVLPGQGGLDGVHVLRTLEDSLALRESLLAASRLVVVGEGVLGAEIAATARTMGLAVTMVGPQPMPMHAQLGPLVAQRLAALHAERGVELRLGVGVDGFTSEGGRVTGVHLSGGEVLPADVVVVAIGAVPQTAWLTGSGLELDNGVVCDSHCRAAPGVFAVGDVARWWHDRLNALVRLENRTNATEQAAAVAANVLGENLPYTPVPYFWSDQYDAKIHVHGLVPPGAEPTIVDGSLEEGRFVAKYDRDGRTTGVVGWNMAKQARIRRQELLQPMG
ncbi:Reductase C-terminal [Saccharopolyspora antimicrobica]|uniref:NAD/ferredoxin-dependent reductase-like protein n=1 Tax=Saccharopolyspora antimicrobica TaxID=455193 RepID=A0A1I5L6U1_9PSEU|nr:FAD/NAD(P)-binding oxidoreductase [Saccharopolyspora antimicrobica]RKT86891.1 NAD/ferredoxin-dependent reductase-like protein [Saccharopolyspora antimicrobica]SFO92451.1 Reductase C-terminal [Saccharopolyspora antimicrobica]